MKSAESNFSFGGGRIEEMKGRREGGWGKDREKGREVGGPIKQRWNFRSLFVNEEQDPEKAIL